MRYAIAMVVLLLAGVQATAAAGREKVDLHAAEAVIQRDVTQGFSGTVLIADGDRIALCKGYGVLHGIPMRAATRYWISSMGKQFVSAAILKLQDHGKLHLDDPLAKWFDRTPPDKHSITIRQLLTHTSGLPNGYVGESASSNSEAVRLLLAVPLVQEPGTGFLYSNENYQLAAALVERVSGLSFDVFETQMFFRPLGLRNIGIANGPSNTAPTRDPTPARLSAPNWGIGGHYASAPDLFHWSRALFGGNVLSPEGLHELITPTIRIQEGEAALAWFVNHTAKGTLRLWTRGNDDYGPNSAIVVYPARGVTMIILTHAGDKPEDLSWSRVVLADLERALLL
jgi:CubicO group peptidase (beta-lactamase class C family)